MPWLRSTSDPQLGQLRLLVVVKRTGTTAPHLGQLKCLPCSPLSEAPSRRPCSLRSSSTTRSPRLSAGGWAEKSTDRTWPCSLRSSTSRYGVPGSGSCASSPWADTSRAFCTLLTVKLLPPSTRCEPSSQSEADRKSTRLHSSHTVISYAVFCFAT